MGAENWGVASQLRCKSGRAEAPDSGLYAAAVTVSMDWVDTSSMDIGVKS